MQIKIKATYYRFLLNRGGHFSRFDCNLIEVVTSAGLTNLIEVVTKAGLSVT
jgi:hypothetical protein